MPDTEDTKQAAVATASPWPPKDLPFEYEDRSDGSYDRVLEEVRAAWLWTQSRRARGLLPS